jgi:hypothetical protein
MSTCTALDRFGVSWLLVAASAIACGGSPVEVDAPTLFLRPGQTPWQDPPLVMATSDTSLMVRAAFAIPCHPWELVPSARLRGRELTVRVEGRRLPGCTVPSPASDTYALDVGNLPTGTVLLRILHAYRDSTVQPETVFVGNVQMPMTP